MLPLMDMHAEDMLLLLTVLFPAVSATWLALALRNKSMAALFVLHGLWWMGALGSGFFTYLSWQGRDSPENWAALGFFFIALPYIVIVGAGLVVEAPFLWKLRREGLPGAEAAMWSGGALMLFLVAQLAAGVWSLMCLPVPLWAVNLPQYL